MEKICRLVKTNCPDFNSGLCIAKHNCGGNAKDAYAMDERILHKINIIYQAKILETQELILEALQRQK